MRLLHTSDWHLGQSLHGQDRDYEHTCFLKWLLGRIVELRPDALLVAGDIFDTVNPPLRAQERLYEFIVSAHEQLPSLTIIMIAGNHDSGSRIELPAPLMRRLRAHALGRVQWLDDGTLDSERLLIPLTGKRGKPLGWCLALPFLRPAEVTGGERGDDYLAGIARVHRELIAAANAKRKRGQALVAISHAHLAGGSVSLDSERSLIIGSAEALPASLFDESIDYVALGHLHKPQRVNADFRLRYSGSPIPLSFSEVDYPHQVLQVDFDDKGKLVDVHALRVPRAVDLKRIGPAPLEEVIEQLQALPVPGLLEEEVHLPWLEVRILLDQPQPDLRQRIEAALLGKAARLVRIAAQYQGGLVAQEAAGVVFELEQMQPQALFTRAWQEQYGSEPDEQTLEDFAQLLQDVQLEDDQP
ncbi:exonuclease SbcCD subunit D C-terminal domain-containing protein [Pseudomonas sp. KNUC1026]|uniref:exonuclease SbcCD subunit D C-terminal domain-containing protein n=1 Tax=Pseudomonas sp. KNUC1026 TaxID=2893890 RepID=UPI001F2D6669|nr:exonuclease SbcCD subunit D C-terminal domain-containing protein [Pseudomonas sp. KNUC1026]UFH50673.1 exonuclease SbcCD subunit D C-terminal domain-containing protein [Pseudomonas sp. KNUC1026]